MTRDIWRQCEEQAAIDRLRRPQEDRTCEAVWTFLGIEGVCGEPAIGLYRRACIHEHLKDGWLCRDHADAPEFGACLTCWDLKGELSHECPITLTEFTPEVSA